MRSWPYQLAWQYQLHAWRMAQLAIVCGSPKAGSAYGIVAAAGWRGWRRGGAQPAQWLAAYLVAGVTMK